MNILILGVCGTFMGGLSLIAQKMGYRIFGMDEGIYPPMSTQLETSGITLIEGYDPADIPASIDLVVIGNVMRRGMPIIEHILNERIAYTSGPAWMGDLIKNKWVLAVSGTHGKTTTSSMVAHILEANGKNPSFLIGGVPENFKISARLTDSHYFVIEADEYDCAFFDKRAKFVHYRPTTLILNNLEFDHADIYPDLSAIQTQFHHLIRTIPSSGQVIVPTGAAAIAEVLEKGLWSTKITFGENGNFTAHKLEEDGSCFDVYQNGQKHGTVAWNLIGDHNVQNALASIAACHHTGLSIKDAIEALESFQNVKRRMELKCNIGNIAVYDDFAHHPTAIALTLGGLRKKIKKSRILLALDFRSNSMKKGTFKNDIPAAVKDADEIFFIQSPDLTFQLSELASSIHADSYILNNIDELAKKIGEHALPGDTIITMSNGAFGGIHEKLMRILESKI